MCDTASLISDSGDSYNEQSVFLEYGQLPRTSREMRMKCGTSRNAVRGTRTRMDTAESEDRGRREERKG